MTGKVLKTGKAMISMKNCSQNEVAIIRDALLSTKFNAALVFLFIILLIDLFFFI